MSLLSLLMVSDICLQIESENNSFSAQDKTSCQSELKTFTSTINNQYISYCKSQNNVRRQSHSLNPTGTLNLQKRKWNVISLGQSVWDLNMKHLMVWKWFNSRGYSCNFQFIHDSNLNLHFLYCLLKLHCDRQSRNRTWCMIWFMILY